MCRMLRVFCLLAPLVLIGACQTSLKGYQTYELEPENRDVATSKSPGVPFRLTKPVYFIEATKDAKGAISGYALKVEYVTDRSRVYWVDICPADLQENDFGLAFGSSGELTTVSSLGADKSKGWVETLAAVAKGALGMYVLAEADTPTDIGVGALATTGAFQDVINIGFTNAALASPLYSGQLPGMNALTAPLDRPGVKVSLEELALKQLRADARSTDGADGAELVEDSIRLLGLDQGARALIKKLEGVNTIDQIPLLGDMLDRLVASLNARLTELEGLTGATAFERSDKARDADAWLDYYARLEVAIDEAIQGVADADKKKQADELRMPIAALVAMVLRLKRGPAQFAALLEAVVKSASEKSITQHGEKSAWVVAARELIEPSFSMAEEPVRSPFWLREIANRRKKLGKELEKRRKRLLIGTGEGLNSVLFGPASDGSRFGLFGFACALERGDKNASDSVKKLLIDLAKKSFYAKATKPKPAPETAMPLWGAKLAKDKKWDCSKRTSGDWKIELSAAITDKEIEEVFKKVMKLADGLDATNQDVRKVIGEYVQPHFTAYAHMLLRYRALTAKNWQDLIVEQRWEAYLAQQRVDVYSGALEESEAFLTAEAQLYMALGHPSMHRHLSRLRYVLEQNPYSDDRKNPESVNQLDDLSKARTQMAEIEAATATQLGSYLPALKVVAKKTQPKWAGSGRMYPRYIYWDGPAISDYPKWLRKNAPDDLENGEYIVLVERFAPDREAFPKELNLPDCAAKEAK